ncbi:unnamed protein product, partial [Ixodes pacificus]
MRSAMPDQNPCGGHPARHHGEEKLQHDAPADLRGAGVSVGLPRVGGLLLHHLPLTQHHVNLVLHCLRRRGRVVPRLRDQRLFGFLLVDLVPVVPVFEDVAFVRRSDGGHCRAVDLGVGVRVLELGLLVVFGAVELLGAEAGHLAAGTRRTVGRREVALDVPQLAPEVVVPGGVGQMRDPGDPAVAAELVA